MSDYTPKPGRGNAFKNTEPDAKAAYSGTLTLPDGTVCFLDIYAATDRETGEKRKDKNGNPWLNVSIKPKSGSPGEPSQQREPQGGRPSDDFTSDTLDDTIPF